MMWFPLLPRPADEKNEGIPDYGEQVTRKVPWRWLGRGRSRCRGEGCGQGAGWCPQHACDWDLLLCVSSHCRGSFCWLLEGERPQTAQPQAEFHNIYNKMSQPLRMEEKMDPCSPYIIFLWQFLGSKWNTAQLCHSPSQDPFYGSG